MIWGRKKWSIGTRATKTAWTVNPYRKIPTAWWCLRVFSTTTRWKRLRAKPKNAPYPLCAPKEALAACIASIARSLISARIFLAQKLDNLQNESKFHFVNKFEWKKTKRKFKIKVKCKFFTKTQKVNVCQSHTRRILCE